MDGQGLEAPEPEPMHVESRQAELSVTAGRSESLQAYTLPGLEEPVTALKAASKPGRFLEDIRAAVAKLKADGQPVNGTTYAALVGVAPRTARRDLETLATRPRPWPHDARRTSRTER
ncbi:hypothetical protein [Streptomyces sp. NPDC048002]|uniref:hypothetical protein n=1 Tax=Streptomyces sp. NPDC048002 TaxID=3154344 RepID=UPI0033DEAD7E